jgi:hypothetical protein
MGGGNFVFAYDYNTAAGAVHMVRRRAKSIVNFLARCKCQLSKHYMLRRDNWVAEPCLSSGILKNTVFRELDLFPPSGERVGVPSLLVDPSGRSVLNHWTTYVSLTTAVYTVTRLVTVDGVLDWQLDLLDPDTITLTAYHNVHPLQQFSRTQHKAGNGSSACVPLQQSSGIPCHRFLTSSPKTTPLNLPTTPRIPTTTLQLDSNRAHNWELRGIWPLVGL